MAALCVPFNQPLYLGVLYVLQNHPPLLGVGAPLNLRGSVPSILGRYTTFTASPPIGLRGSCNVSSIIILLRFKVFIPIGVYRLSYPLNPFLWIGLAIAILTFLNSPKEK